MVNTGPLKSTREGLYSRSVGEPSCARGREIKHPCFCIRNMGPQVITKILTQDRYSTHPGTNITELKVTGTFKGRAAEPA